MCGRNSLFVPQSELEERFDATATEPIAPQYNVAPGEDLRIDPISRAADDPANDSPAIVEPVAVDEQSGLGDFQD